MIKANTEAAIAAINVFGDLNSIGAVRLEDLGFAASTAIDALSKEIPVPPKQDIKKPRYGMGYEYYDWFCPKCNGFLEYDCEGTRHFGLSRCGRCGQVIDWDKKEDAL